MEETLADISTSGSDTPLTMLKTMFALLAASTLLLASAPPSPVPEPSTYLLMGAGLGALMYARHRFGKKK